LLRAASTPTPNANYSDNSNSQRRTKLPWKATTTPCNNNSSQKSSTNTSQDATTTSAAPTCSSSTAVNKPKGITDFVEGKRESAPYKGPDLLVVVGVDGTKRRKHWVVWDEDDRFPDLIVEITSPSTKSKDTGENLKLFAQVFRTREYFWYDEEAGEWMGYRLQGESYVPIEVNARGWRWSEVLGAWLGVSELPYRGWRYRWLRLYDVGGRLVPTGEELAAAERERAEAERQRAEQAERRIERERRRAEQERQRAETERQRAEQERQRAEQAERRLAELEAELKRLRSDG
jgi:hypothetical protein